MRDITQGIGLDVKPYGRATSRHDDTGDDVDLDAGVDLFYKLTPAVTLTLTINTDFAEIEVDEREVNLTRFPLFFPEKRDFFLQGFYLNNYIENYFEPLAIYFQNLLIQVLFFGR